MKAADLRDKTPEQLREQLEALRKEAFNLRFRRATGQLENTHQMRSVRRDAARVQTLLNEKARTAASETAASETAASDTAASETAAASE